MYTYYNSLRVFLSKHLSPTIFDWLKTITQILVIIVTYFLVHQGLFWLTTLPFNAYYHEFIYAEFLNKIISKPYLVIFLLLGIGYFNKNLFISWQHFGNTNLIRRLIIVVSFVLTWYFSTYDTNFYFNQTHNLDRILLILLFIASWWKPFFLIPYLTVLLLIIGQFESLPVFSIATPSFLLIKILLLFVTFYILKLVTKSFNPVVFIFILGCLIATHYITPGIRKFNFYWIFKNQINFMVPSAYANGWLSFLSAKKIANLASFLSWFNTPLSLFAVTIECGMLLFFINKKWTRFLIFGAMIMHLGIFGYSGILFWLWIVVLIFSSFLFSTKQFNLQEIYNKKYFTISVFLIIGGYFWCQARSLTWYDSPLSYTYKIYGETANGKRERLNPNFFSHYDFQITKGMMKFWQNQPRLPIVWGATNKHISSFFNTERTVEEVLEFEKANGILHKNDTHRKKYENFMIQYLTHWNNRSSYLDLRIPIKALPFYWTSPPYKITDIKENITKVIIVESTTFYSKSTGFNEIRSQEIKTLKIPNSQPKP